MRLRACLVLSVAAVSVACGLGCSGPSAPGNSDPQIASLTADPDSVSAGGTVSLSCVATDADSDSLSYQWDCEHGVIQGQGHLVFWVAPGDEGACSISCTVTDGQGGRDLESLMVRVGPCTHRTIYWWRSSTETWEVVHDVAPGDVTGLGLTELGGFYLATGSRLYIWRDSPESWELTHGEAPGHMTGVAVSVYGSLDISVGRDFYRWDTSSDSWVPAFGEAPGDITGFDRTDLGGHRIAVGRLVYLWSSTQEAWVPNTEEAPGEIRGLGITELGGCYISTGRDIYGWHQSSETWVPYYDTAPGEISRLCMTRYGGFHIACN